MGSSIPWRQSLIIGILETELRHGTASSINMVDGFVMTFIFEDDCPNTNATINIVKKNIF